MAEGRNPGMAVDAEGNTVIDPTKNVFQLVDAAVARLDDLRNIGRQFDGEIRCAEARRIDDLRAAESRRIDEQMALRDNHARELREAEAKRIDAIRAVDVNAVAVASERATQQANVLASQVLQSADTLRTLVTSTAATMASQQDTIIKQFNERISSIEKSQYENKGKSGVTDPMFENYITKMDSVLNKLSQNTGTTGGRKEMWGWVVGAIMLAITLYTLFNKAGMT